MGYSFARRHIPRAAVRPRALQRLQVPALSSAFSCLSIPREVVLPRPLQGRQVPAWGLLSSTFRLIVSTFVGY